MEKNRPWYLKEVSILNYRNQLENILNSLEYLDKR